MEAGAIALFMISLILFISAVVVILYDQSMAPPDVDQTSSGIPLPDSTMIGGQCPVGCTCFPNTGATTSTDKPTQICAFLDNGTMFSCPAQCCQPTCINQDVQGIAPRVSQ
jgi:hypothetical protein